MRLVEPLLRDLADHRDLFHMLLHERLDDFIQFKGADTVVRIRDLRKSRVDARRHRDTDHAISLGLHRFDEFHRQRPDAR